MDNNSPPTVLRETVAKNVRAELARREITTQQVMVWTSLSAQTVRSKRAGRTAWTLAELDRLAQGLGIPPFDLTAPIVYEN